MCEQTVKTYTNIEWETRLCKCGIKQDLDLIYPINAFSQITDKKVTTLVNA